MGNPLLLKMIGSAPTTRIEYWSCPGLESRRFATILEVDDTKRECVDGGACDAALLGEIECIAGG